MIRKQRYLARAVRIVAGLLLCLPIAIDCSAQVPLGATDSSLETFFLARDDGEGYASDAALSFSITDNPIHCVIELKSAEEVTVKMNFVAVSVPGVKAGSQIVTASYTTKDGENIVKFRGGPIGLWTAGIYRVDIFVGGRRAATQEFPIVGRPATAVNQTKFVDVKPQRASPRGKPKTRPRRN